jgi:hypothetical protein
LNRLEIKNVLASARLFLEYTFGKVLRGSSHFEHTRNQKFPRWREITLLEYTFGKNEVRWKGYGGLYTFPFFPKNLWLFLFLPWRLVTYVLILVIGYGLVIAAILHVPSVAPVSPLRPTYTFSNWSINLYPGDHKLFQIWSHGLLSTQSSLPLGLLKSTSLTFSFPLFCLQCIIIFKIGYQKHNLADH